MSENKRRLHGNTGQRNSKDTADILLRRYLELISAEPEKLTPDVMRHIDQLAEQICRMESSLHHDKNP